ncbi:MAG: hypothetical protein ACLGG9_06580 [Thermoleophilia bacterium]
MTPRLAVSALDAEGAIRAAAGASLGRGLMLASAFGVLLASAALVALILRGAYDGTPRGPWRVGLPFGAAGAGVIALIGGAVAAWAAQRNGSIVAGDSGIAAITGTAIGAWSIAAMALGVLAIVLAFIDRRRRAPRVGWPVALVLAACVAGGSAVAADLPSPARQAEATVALDDTTQATVVLTPGAAGSNDIRIALSGPRELVGPLRDAVRTEGARAELRALASGETSAPVALDVDDEGNLVGGNLVATAPGRWRVSFTLPGRAEPVITDVTLQPNPAFQG